MKKHSEIANFVGSPTLPTPGRLTLPELLGFNTKTWAINLDHGALCVESEYSSAPGWLKKLMDHAGSMTFYRYSVMQTILCLNDLQADKVKKPLLQRAGIVKTHAGSLDSVAPSMLRVSVYGPADAVSKHAYPGQVWDNARPKVARAEGRPLAELPQNRLVRLTATRDPDVVSVVLMCPITMLYDPQYAAQRVRVNFKKELTAAQAFQLCLTFQAEEHVLGVHMAGKDAVLVMDSPVTTGVLAQIKRTDGVFGARSQKPPHDEVPRIGGQPTLREVATIVPITELHEVATLTSGFVTLVQGDDPRTPAAWDVVIAQIVEALGTPVTRVGACNFIAAQVRLSRVFLDGFDGDVVTVAAGKFQVTSHHMLA